MELRCFLSSLGVILISYLPLPAQPMVSYARNVRPFLAKYCVECHNSKDPERGLNLETYESITKGAEDGPVLVPGKADASLLVLLPEGKKKPRMPPMKAKRQPQSNEIAILRAWVNAGAKDDSAAVKIAIPDIKPRQPSRSPIAALLYHPVRPLLAAGTYKSVVLLNPETRARVGVLRDLPGTVTALAFRRDGKMLAVAAGRPGDEGTILLYAVPPEGNAWAKPIVITKAHRDLILDMAFSPDSKILATASYDTKIKLWDVASTKELRTLKDHSDCVYGLSFHPDGTLLASGAADRTVKVWQVASGKLLYTLGESTDWIYAVAWNPDGRHLAGAGVDKSIRVWRTGSEKGRIESSVFAHEAPVTRLVYAPDGKTLFSLGEDRIVKAWDAGRMVERRVFSKQAEVALAMALRADQKQFALGRFDGSVVFVDPANGSIHSVSLGPGQGDKSLATARSAPPHIGRASPEFGQRGRPIRVRFTGKNLDSVSRIDANVPGASVKIIAADRSPGSLEADVSFPATTPAGKYKLTFHGTGKTSTTTSFVIDLFATSSEQEPNDSPGRGQWISLPATVAGMLNKTGDVDFYRFRARAGQQLGIQIVTAALGSKVEPYLRLIDERGNELANSDDALLGYTFARDGEYALGVCDRQLRGGGSMFYRLHLGEIPIITAVFPLGVQRGREADIGLQGVFLGSRKRLRIKQTSDAVPGSRLPIRLDTPRGVALGDRNVVVGEFPDVFVNEPRSQPALISVPGAANGIIRTGDQTDVWKFYARKGEKLILETDARRLGSPLDSYIEILDSRNQPLERATLRSIAKTFVTFRDHDSRSAGIRIDTWDELAVNDSIFAGSELLRIKELPANPDADCIFFSERGQRIGYLDTTPTHLPLGTPMYKVEIHPRGMHFPPNGFPVIRLYYRNDDGGPAYGRDSRIFFDPPADGEYRVRIGDSRNQGGPGFAYRLTVRPPRPRFLVSFNPGAPEVFRGSSTPIIALANRIDGFDGEITVHLENLPPGFSAPDTTIPAGENSTVFALFAKSGAMVPAKTRPLKLVARATVDGKQLVQEAQGGPIKVKEPGDLVTTTEQSEVTLKPGARVQLTVHIERRNDFKGRVPLDVRGLPHGVRVLDIGLNGILITENESRRVIVIYAEPWVRPMTHPFVVLSRSERKNTEHGAQSVLLRVKN
jgi:WD40 repeat protein